MLTGKNQPRSSQCSLAACLRRRSRGRDGWRRWRKLWTCPGTSAALGLRWCTTWWCSVRTLAEREHTTSWDKQWKLSQCIQFIFFSGWTEVRESQLWSGCISSLKPTSSCCSCLCCLNILFTLWNVIRNISIHFSAILAAKCGKDQK